MQELEKILEEIEIRAIKDLEEENDRCSTTCEGCCSDVNERKCNCRDAIIVRAFKKLAKCMNDGWIPVEERLPEEKKSVLVQWEKYNRYLNVTLTYLDVMWLEDEEDVVFETDNGIPNGRVIAWRPLPEPYYLEPEAKKPNWREDMLRKFDRRE